MDIPFTEKQVTNIRSLDAARLLAAKFFSQKESCTVVDYFQRTWPRSLSRSLVEKSAVSVGSSASGNWASALAAAYPPELLSALVAAAAPEPVLPRLKLPRAPFNRKVAIDRGDTSGLEYWVNSPGGSKPVIANTFGAVMLPPTVAAGIFVLTEETFEFSAPGSVEYLRDWLSWQITRFLDRSAFDPTVGPASETSPASLTYGAPTVTASGHPADDVRALIAEYISQGGRIESAAFVLSSENSAAFALLDSDAFRNMTISGGVIAGIPAYAASAVGDTVALIDRSRAALADDGIGNLSVSQQGTLSMVDTSVSPPTEAQQVSLWQSNSIAVKFEKVIHWAASGGTVYTTHNYALAGSPS